MRICTQCNEEKPEESFYRRTRGTLMTECKACNIKRAGVWYKANREHARKRENLKMVDTRWRTKEAVFAAYGGFRCACCGETEREFLTLDHVENNGSTHRRKVVGKRYAAGFQTYAWIVRNGFPPGFQVLCMNCNWGKRRTGVCPHKERCNDYPKGVEPSGSKRTGSFSTLLKVVKI
jgi:hypothetical protein